MKKKLILILTLLAVTTLAAGYFISQTRKTKFEVPRTGGQIVQSHVGKEATLMGVANNLSHYGFIKDENAFNYALENSKDSTPGNEDA